jgi:ABC-type nickel/cobalt efflux system permease component RcnA
MLEDIYLEYMIKKKKTGKQKAIIALVVTAGLVLTAAMLAVIFVGAVALQGTQISQFAFSIGFVLIALMWYGAYLIISMQNIEFEYILTNSEIDIDKIMSKKGRKHIVSFDFKDVTVCAAVEDKEHNHDYENVKPDKIYNAIGDSNGTNIYFADFSNDTEKARLLFQPTYKMISSAKRYNPRNIHILED